MKTKTAKNSMKELSEAVDKLYAAREARYVLQKQIKALEKEESELRELIISNLPKSNSNGLAGKVALAKIEVKEKAVVVDWEKFYVYVGKKKAFDLLQRRLNESAVIERWSNKEDVPGVGTFNAVTLSLTKLK